MYKSPIEAIVTEWQTQVIRQREDGIYRAVQNLHVDVDKEELIKALKYDREQYGKGYEDALNQVKENIIKKLRAKQRGYLDLYDEYKDGEDYRNSLLLEEVIDIIKETY